MIRKITNQDIISIALLYRYLQDETKTISGYNVYK